MERDAETKKELIENLADLRQQLADMKKLRSETKNSLLVLQASETRYRRLFETAQDGILILNAETGEIDDVNPYMIDMLHYSREDFLGMKLWEVSPFKDKVFNRVAFEELQDKGYIRYNDLPLETKEGKPIAVEFVSNVYTTNGNKVIQCNIRNITERKEMNRKLKGSDIFQQRLIDTLPLPVFYKDSEGRYLGCNSSFEQFFRQKREQITGKSVYELVPRELADIYNEKDLVLLRNQGIQIYESVIKDTDGVVHNVIIHKATFSNMDGSVGGLIGAVLDITDYRRVEEELRISEERFKAIFNQGPMGIALIDSMTGCIFMVNPMFAKITHRTMEEATHTDWMSITHPDDVRETLDSIALLNAGAIDGFRKQIRCLRPDDSIVWLNMTVAPLRVEDKLYPQHLYMIEDITEHRQAEEDLKESAEKYRELYDFLPIPVYEMDFKANITSANRATYETFGGTEKDLKAGINAWQLLSPESIDKSKKNITRLLKGEKIEDTEYTLKRMDGSTFPAIVISSLTYHNGKPVGLKGAIVDITERKWAEDELKESKILIEAVVENIPLMIFLKEAIDLRFVVFNRAGEELLGYDRKDLLGKNNLDLFPPEQAAHFMAKDREVLDGHAGVLDIPEEPIQTAKKGLRILHTRKVCIRGSDGTTKYLLGISEDITERKEVEKQLRDTLENLRKAVGVTIQVMGSALETRDPYTAGHQIRSADLARAIATEMGLPRDKIDGIRMAGSIHDIGKLSIPAEILSKPTELSKNESALIKEHACQGYKILKHVESSWPLAEIVYQHHERMDGSGYPRHLKGDDILMEARILAVADVVEAMASNRPYRPALGLNAALEEIEKNRGTFYDEVVADACLRLFRERGFQLERI